MSRLRVEEVPPTTTLRPALEPVQAFTPTPAEAPVHPTTVKTEAQTLDVVLMAFTALGYAISARALLLLAVVGAFALAVMAMGDKSDRGLWILIAYAVLTIFPLAFLELKKRG